MAKPGFKTPERTKNKRKLWKILLDFGINRHGMTNVELTQLITDEVVTKQNWNNTLKRWVANGCKIPDKLYELNKNIRPPKINLEENDKQYKEYLKGDLWNAIRTAVLVIGDYKCYGCGKKATQVHHMSYDEETMRGQDITKLVPVCRKCHKHIEFENEIKVNLEAANKRLDLLRKENGL